jgi:MFS family permease
MHPFIKLLSRRPVRVAWIGLALSAVGDELYRVGVIWLSVKIAGGEASYVPAAQFAAMLFVSAGAGIVIDHYRSSSVMISSDLIRAFVSIMPVAATALFPLSLPMLVFSAVALAAMRALFEPSLQFSLPSLAREPEELRAINGLFDATVRLARLVGPFLAGLLSIFLPTIHLLTANALSFLISAVSIAVIRKTLNRSTPTVQAETSISKRLLHGFTVLRRHRDIRIILIVHTIIFGIWILGVTVGIPLLLSESASSQSGLVSVGLIFGAYGLGDFISNIVITARAPDRPWNFMFSGYILMGAMLMFLPAGLLAPSYLQIPIMAVLAFFSGIGGPMFFIQMMTTIQRRFTEIDLASVLRLRISVTAAATVLFGVLGPVLFHTLGAPVAVSICGLLIAMSAIAGMAWRSAPAEAAISASEG